MPLDMSVFLVSAGCLDLSPRGNHHDLDFSPQPLSLIVLPTSNHGLI